MFLLPPVQTLGVLQAERLGLDLKSLQRTMSLYSLLSADQKLPTAASHIKTKNTAVISWLPIGGYLATVNGLRTEAPAAITGF